MFVFYALDWLKIARFYTAALKIIELNREDIFGPEYDLRPRMVSFRHARSTANRVVTTSGVKKKPNLRS